MKAPTSLFHLLFGEQAEAARKMAPERSLRWNTAFERWQRPGENCGTENAQHRVRVWREFLALLRKPPWEADESDVRAYLDWLFERDHAPATIAKRLFTLSTFYQFAQDELGQGEEICDPTSNIRLPYKWYQTPMNYLSLAEAQALLGAIDRDTAVLGKRDYAIILACLTCGLRHSDLNRLRWGDLEVDEANGRAWAKRSRPEAPRAEIPMEVVEAIRDYLRAAGRLESMQAEAFIFAPVRNMFSTALLGRAEDWKTGHAVNWDTISIHLKQYAAWAGLDESRINFLTLHTTAFMFRLEAGDTAAELGEFFDYKADAHVQKLIYRLKRSVKRPLWKRDPKPKNTQQQHPTTVPSEANPTNRQNQEDHPMQDQTNDEYFSPGGEIAGLTPPYRRPVYPAQLPSPTLQHGLYARALPESEMALAAQNRQGNLDGEIDALRVVMMRTLLRANDAEDPKDQMRLLEVFSTAAQRLSTLLKAHRELDGGQSELESLIQSISQDILSEHGWPDAEE